MSTNSAPMASAPQKGLVLFLGALIAIGPASVDMYLPSLPTLRVDLATSAYRVQWTLSAFFLGYAIGQLFVGPASDRFGRIPVLVAGLSLFALVSLLCSVSPNVETLAGLRLIQGICGSTGVTTARAIARDVYSGSAMARVISIMMVVAAGASFIAPFLGSYIVLLSSWRAIFVFHFVFAIAAALVTYCFFEETHLRANRVKVGLFASLRNYRAILRDRRGLGYVLSGGFAFGTLFAYVSGIPFVYMEHFRVSPHLFPWLFALNVAGLVTGSVLSARFVARFGADRLLNFGATISASSALVLLFFGWTGIGGIPAFATALLCTIGVTHLINSNANAGLLEHYPRIAGTASAVFGAAQFGFGAVCSVLVGEFFTGGPESMVTVIAFSAAIAYAAQRFLVRV